MTQITRAMQRNRAGNCGLETLESRLLFDAMTVSRRVEGHVVDAQNRPLEFVNVGASVSVGLYSAMTTDPDVAANKTSAVLDGDFNFSIKVGTAFYVNGKFDHFDPISTKFTVTAQDLSGVKHTQTFEFDLGSGADPQAKNPPPIQLPDLALSDYDVVNPDGTITLHKGKTDRPGHIIRAAPANPTVAERLIFASERYQDELVAVATRLRDLGFRQNDSGAALATNIQSWGSAQKRATMLFQSLTTDPSNPDRTFNNALLKPTANPRVNGNVGAGTLENLNDFTRSIWVDGRTQAPANIKFKTGSQSWMTTTMLDALKKVTGTHTITDASKGTGGPFGPHKSHSVGLAFDTNFLASASTEGISSVFFSPLGTHAPNSVLLSVGTGVPFLVQEYTLDARKADIAKLKTQHPTWTAEKLRITAEDNAFTNGKRWIVAKNYDRESTRKYLQQLAKLPNEKLLYFNDPALYSDPILKAAHLTPMPDHSNHIHVGFKFSTTAISGTQLAQPQTFVVSGGIDKRLNKDGDKNLSDHTLGSIQQTADRLLLQGAAAGMAAVAPTASSFLFHFLDGSGTPRNLPSDSLLSLTAANSQAFAKVRDSIFSQITKGLKASGPGGTGKIVVHPDPAKDLVQFSELFDNPDLALVFHGTQGLKVDGKLTRSGSKVSGFINFTVLDVYGFGRSDTTLPVGTGKAAVELQNHGNASAFETSMVVRVPFSATV